MDSSNSIISSYSDETSSLLNKSLCDFEQKSDCSDDIIDTRSELKFDDVLESIEEIKKRSDIEAALRLDENNLKTWQKFAKERYGLVNDNLRCAVWPLLLNVDPNPEEKAPLLDELSNHSEYSQVVLDVNRSLKRFPPGIPLAQRLALQDQLTVLILRVIMKYPHLRYYQGYHDVAITFLLVVGETVAFRIMEKLSTENLRECMEPTMEKTSYRLNYIYAILYKADRALHDHMDRASVGTMFALPWYLTWFGHSLNQYKEVVRLYDYFLASPPLMPLYVAAALIMQRRKEVLEEDCDMASIHCLLSQIPDDVDFEDILEKAWSLYLKFPPEKLEASVKKRVHNELTQRKRDEQLMRKRLNRNKSMWAKLHHCVPDWFVLNYRGKYGLLFAAATVLIGFYAYYLKTNAKVSLFGWLNT